MSSANLRRALDRPAPPAALRGPNVGRRPQPRSAPLMPYPPLAWYYRLDPAMLLCALYGGAGGLYVLGWMAGLFP